MRLPRPRATRAAGLLVAAALVVPAAPGPAAQAATADSWRVPGERLGHAARARLRARARHVAVRRGGGGPTGPDLPADRRLLLPRDHVGHGPGRVTVLLGADTSDDLEVLARPGLTVRDGAGEPVALPDNGATRWSVRVTRTGANRVVFLTDRWHRWGELTGEGEFSAGGEAVTLVTPGGTRAYRGRLRAVAPAPGSRARDTVNEVSMENYLRGVVPLEMPALWSPEAVRTQAVAARTYAAYERAHPRTDRYQLCDTSSCQVYGGYSAEHPASNDAVDATRRLALLSDGEPAFTQFGSSSGGWTSAGSVPYLDAHADPYDDWAGNPVHAWSLRVQDAAVRADLAGDREPDPADRHRPRRQRRLGRADPVDHDHRHEGPGHRLRRHVPVRPRPPLHLADLPGRPPLTRHVRSPRTRDRQF